MLSAVSTRCQGYGPHRTALHGTSQARALTQAQDFDFCKPHSHLPSVAAASERQHHVLGAIQGCLAVDDEGDSCRRRSDVGGAFDS